MLTHGRAPLPPLLLLLYPREARARRSRLPPTRLQAAASFVRCTSGAAASAPQRQHSRGRRRGLACRGPSPCPGCGPPRQAPAPAHSRAAAGGGKRRLQGSRPAGQEHQAVRAGEAGWQAGLHCAAHRSVPGAGGPAQSRTCSWLASNPGVSSMCWRSRPGVQTRMFMPAGTTRGPHKRGLTGRSISQARPRALLRSDGLQSFFARWPQGPAVRLCCPGHQALALSPPTLPGAPPPPLSSPLRLACFATGPCSPCTRACSSFTSLPPMSRPAERSCRLPTLRSSSKICTGRGGADQGTA